MKKLLFIFLIILSFQVIAESGNEGPNGGDPLVFEFVSLGKVITDELKDEKYSELLRDLQIEVSKLEEKILTGSRVYSLDHVFLRDRTEVGAINYVRRNRIVMGAIRWKSYNISQKLSLVLHEYLSLLEVELNIYDTSLEFIEALRAVKVKLIEERSDIIRYYATRTVTRPLFGHNQTCDINAQFLAQGRDAARYSAINSCAVDTQRECEFVQFKIKVASNENRNHWNLSCEIEAVAKIKE